MIEVSVIIPCRNEEKFIAKCLESIISQDFPKENLEVLIIDGMSEDKTREIIKTFNIRHSTFNIQLIDNHKKFTPQGLNIGIKAAKGEIIIRMDAHAGYEEDYISKCVRCLKEYEADNVGGIIKTLASQDTIEARAIAIILSSSLGAASSFRLGADKPKEVDTVFGGCYKREVFDKVGFFDERMQRSQDIEFNKRLKKAGGKIILTPDIVATHYPQSTLLGFTRHNFIDGFWVTYPLKFGVRYFSIRHLAPLFFIGILVVSLALGFFSFLGKLLFIFVLGIYLLWITFSSLAISIKRGWKYLFVLPLAVFSRHFAYGFGSIWGLVRIAI